MCTVSYLPLGEGNFILTSNRDENPLRLTLEPGDKITLNEQSSVICPKDSKAGGTWVAMSVQGRAACLLNGAFIKHHHHPPYRKSRGLIVMDYFTYADAPAFAEKIDLDEIENFTLVLLEEGHIYELRWDGKEKFFKTLDAGIHHLWSSCTLYEAPVAAAKEEKFDEWVLSGAELNMDTIQFFHGLNNPSGFLLELPMVKTVSITSIQKKDREMIMDYHDLLNGHHITKSAGIIEE